MNKEEIINGIVSAMSDLQIPYETIYAEKGLETKIVDDLGLDSLDIIEMAFQIEERLNIPLKESDIEKLKNGTLSTLGDLVELLSINQK